MTIAFPSFPDFFRALHGHDPFPWQSRLAETVVRQGWPGALGLPTAAGKTSCIDIAVYALAREAAEGSTPRRMPRRIVLVVDRRIVVDDAFARGAHIADSIGRASKGPLLPVREALDCLGGEKPLHSTVLRGAIHRDERWARTPLQPTVVVSTVDQVGSRLLFRGYGLSDGQRPLHAGLLANDTLLILDEAHLSRPFEETLDWIAHHRRQGEQPLDLPFGFVRMTATPPPNVETFNIDDDDRNHPVLGRRLRASKPARLLEPVEFARLPKVMAEAAHQAAAPGSTVAVVVNRVATARAVLEALRKFGKKLDADLLLLTGRSRPHERDTLLERHRSRIASGRDRALHADAKPLIVVATQCIEAGADVDFDFLVTECAPLDALRQRFGRLDRLGELDPSDAGIRAVIVANAKSLKDDDDPVYGPGLAATWKWLFKHSTTDPDNRLVDFGISALTPPEGDALAPLLSPRQSAPLLQRAYCDLLAQTSPEPVPSPDPAVFLHGIDRGDPEVQIVWRADLGDDPRLWADVVALCPPVAGEALAVRLSVARAWLAAELDPKAPSLLEDADLEGLVPPPPPRLPKAKPDATAVSEQEDAEEDEEEDEEEAGDDADVEALPVGGSRPALRWRGPDDSATAFALGDIQPGDTLIVPVTHGGCDQFGWNPASLDPVRDIAEEARTHAGRARVLRLHPALPCPHEALDPLRTLAEEPEEGLRSHAAECLAAAGEALPRAARVELHPTGTGVVVTWPGDRRAASFADTDDTSSRAAVDQRVPLSAHQIAVAAEARRYAEKAGLSASLVEVLAFAGRVHDLGKADPRFQAWLCGGNPLFALREPEPLAKSGRAPGRPGEIARARAASGYPRGARHELLSTALLQAAPGLPVADADLLLHLVASHHGYCRPFPPVVEDSAPLDVSVALDGVGTLTASTATGLERLDSGVPARFFRLMRRHGWWGLAYLESLLRLADHRVSERGPQED
jgi:CRISPR-associated endonuclease/helicase Cas3